MTPLTARLLKITLLTCVILGIANTSLLLRGDTLPNIILINADDLGYGDLSSYGATQVRTPNIDRLAKEGRRFTDAHTASAVCSPSRYGLLTGKYPLRRNFWGPTSLQQGLTIDTNFLTLASMLDSKDYNTACIGKWHLGFGTDTPDWNGDLNPGPLEVGSTITLAFQASTVALLLFTWKITEFSVWIRKIHLSPTKSRCH